MVRETSEIVVAAEQLKKKWAAVVLSLFLPGFGQIYLGKSERGASILVGFILVFAASYLFIFQTAGRGFLFDIGSRYLQFLAILFWAWQIYDAYILAKG